MSELPPTVTSLVVHDGLTKPEILDAIAASTGSTVIGAGSAHARVEWDQGGSATVDVPKFGEDTPLAIDLHGVTSEFADAVRAALAATGLSVTRLGDTA